MKLASKKKSAASEECQTCTDAANKGVDTEVRSRTRRILELVFEVVESLPSTLCNNILSAKRTGERNGNDPQTRKQKVHDRILGRYFTKEQNQAQCKIRKLRRRTRSH